MNIMTQLRTKKKDTKCGAKTQDGQKKCKSEVSAYGGTEHGWYAWRKSCQMITIQGRHTLRYNT